MKTLLNFSKGLSFVSTNTSWYLSDLAEYRGKQELYTHQVPQKLKLLKEHAIIESSISSNRMEGVEIDAKRIGTVIFGKGNHYKDRNEEEIAGYKRALSLIHEEGQEILLNVETIKNIHALTRGEIWDAGKYKEKDGDIIEKYPDGRERVRFKTVSALQTASATEELLKLWHELMRDKQVPSLILLAAFNLDFLCIHPFRDGNGRVSRLLLLLQSYHLGFEVGRYISLEKLIEENKERYYETLEQSSQGWHEGKHDPWPYINYMLSIFKSAYKEFEGRVGEMQVHKGGKTELIVAAINKQAGKFAIGQIQKSCPGSSVDMIRKVLKDLKKAGKVECLGRGKDAYWKKLN
ncbi:MAG: Fic family protein [Oligoflexia bacterium]|nr:Fic family protein [Oligoflexia bacterium]